MTEEKGDNPGFARKSLRALILEDNPGDVELMTVMLKRVGYALSYDVVDSPEEFKEKLAGPGYDVILADYNLRTWTGMEALEILERAGKDIPFIVVTGTLGDEAAVECIKQGAADYVLKHRLQRLPVVVENVLREKAHREEEARLQEQIRQAKEDWELTFDTVPDAVFILDTENRIHRVNRSATKMLGLQFEQMIGRPCHEVLHGAAGACAHCPHQWMLETGQTARGDIEEPHLGKVLEVTASPLREADGSSRGCVCVVRDVTDRKRAEVALREALDTLRALIQASPLGIAVLDEDGHVKLWNPAAERMFGWSEPEVLGRPVLTVPETKRDEHRALRERVMRGEAYTGVEVSRLKKDGSTLDISLSTAPLHDAKGKVVGIVGMMADITERKRLEEQILRTQKMESIGQLAGGIAHDFNNLLTIITGYSELLLETQGAGERSRVYVKEIKDAADRATALTRQLLAFGRRQVLQPQVLDLNAVVANMDKMLRRLIGEDIDLVTACDKGLWGVKADPGQIEQVIMNLAVNARDAMPQGGRLTLETANVELDEAYARNHVTVTPGPYVMLAVSDTGVGMDAETQAHIFEPFFTTKDQGKGTGLGLATVYGIVKQSGGNIWVYSEPGRGTTLKIYLPRVEEVGEAVAPEPARAAVPGGAETVLLVEDEDAVRTLVRGVLESNGYKVLEANGPTQALLISDRYEKPIHLLLTDVVMPQMSGQELAAKLAPRHPETKVLFMSGYTDNAIVHHGVLDAGTAFLQKPFTPEAVARKVREVLDCT